MRNSNRVEASKSSNELRMRKGNEPEVFASFSWWKKEKAIKCFLGQNWNRSRDLDRAGQLVT